MSRYADITQGPFRAMLFLRDYYGVQYPFLRSIWDRVDIGYEKTNVIQFTRLFAAEAPHYKREWKNRSTLWI